MLQLERWGVFVLPVVVWIRGCFLPTKPFFERERLLSLVFRSRDRCLGFVVAPAVVGVSSIDTRCCSGHYSQRLSIVPNGVTDQLYRLRGTIGKLEGTCADDPDDLVLQFVAGHKQQEL